MKKEEIFDRATIDKFTLEMKKIASVKAIDDFAIILGGDRIKWSYLEDTGRTMIRGIMRVATQEEPLCKYPADWWQHVKERWFRKWMLRRWPVKYEEVIAMHKFPELDPPAGVLGREFVHLEIVDSWKLQDKLLKEKD